MLVLPGRLGTASGAKNFRWQIALSRHGMAALALRSRQHVPPSEILFQPFSLYKNGVHLCAHLISARSALGNSLNLTDENSGDCRCQVLETLLQHALFKCCASVNSN